MSKIFNTKVLSIITIVMGMMLLNSCKKEFTITVQSNNEAWGNVIGGGEYKKGTIVQLLATPATGYQFGKWDDGNTDNPRSITVEKNATYTAVFVIEKVDAYFSVSATNKVYFSPGNLQWSATNGGSTPTTHVVADSATAAGTWRFAPNQWDMIGSANSNISSTYTGWIDLFGWGTSGYNNKYPYMTSISNTEYGNGNNDISNTYYDWGVYNAIYNPKTQNTDAPGTWRTLTEHEWEYLLNTRPTASSIRYAKATVWGIVGLIIVPDSCSNIYYPLNNVNTSSVTYTSNIIGEADWAKMEAVGCVFLPATGYRIGTSVDHVGSYGVYWSSTYYYISGEYNLDFYVIVQDSSGGDYRTRYRGESVRLVRDVE